MTTNHERLEDKLVEEEKSKPAEISPVLGLKQQTDRARDVQAQSRGEISRLYDVGEAPVPAGGVSAPSPLENAPKAIPIETPEHINSRLLQFSREDFRARRIW